MRRSPIAGIPHPRPRRGEGGQGAGRRMGFAYQFQSAHQVAIIFTNSDCVDASRMEMDIDLARLRSVRTESAWLGLTGNSEAQRSGVQAPTFCGSNSLTADDGRPNVSPL